MAYIYRHIRSDKNEVFYIGIGSDAKHKRALDIHHRSKHWTGIYNKTIIEYEILFDNLTWNDACNKEIELIAFYGREDLGNGSLVNLTDGGEGTLGFQANDEYRKKMSKSLMGRPIKEETKVKLSAILTGRKLSDEHRKKISLYQKGKAITEETREKMKLGQQKRHSKNKVA